jgi:hypothetical protein
MRVVTASGVMEKPLNVAADDCLLVTTRPS